MSDSHTLPEMREFVMSLLVVAAGESRSPPKTLDIVDNAALRYCIELSGALPELLRHSVRDPSLGGWLEDAVAAAGFFEFCGSLLDAVDHRLRGRHPRFARRRGDEPTSYDHAALLALGQTLCHAAGVRGGKFPQLSTGLRRVSAVTPVQMQRWLIANYLGNVLQDYFEASRIRAEFPKLPPDTENTLRYQEAVALAECIFKPVHQAERPLEVSAVQRALRDVIHQVWKAEKALDG